MNRRELVIAALNLEEPDQVPTHVIYLDANNVDNIMGKPERNDFEMMRELQEEYPDDWLEQLNQIVEQMEVSIFYENQEERVISARDFDKVFKQCVNSTEVGIFFKEITPLKTEVSFACGNVGLANFAAREIYSRLNSKTFKTSQSSNQDSWQRMHVE